MFCGSHWPTFLVWCALDGALMHQAVCVQHCVVTLCRLPLVARLQKHRVLDRCIPNRLLCFKATCLGIVIFVQATYICLCGLVVRIH